MIDKVLIGAITSFKENTGKKPMSIYLGRDEVMQLKKWVEFAYHQSLDMSHGPEFYGIKVYEVVTDRHIGIG